MKINAERIKDAQMDVAARRATRGTQVRVRCRGGRSVEEAGLKEVQQQVREALPHIVRANVEKAKGGSLVHTKWLWGVASKGGSDGARKAKASLAEMLLEQLGEEMGSRVE